MNEYLIMLSGPDSEGTHTQTWTGLAVADNVDSAIAIAKKEAVVACGDCDPRELEVLGCITLIEGERQQYIIRSTHRDEAAGFFVAVHSSTPFFSSQDKACRFSSREMAMAYARLELFTEDSAFEVVSVGADERNQFDK
jgi:hypothetical protein